MKKICRVFVILAIACAMTVAAIMLAACFKVDSYYGEFSYDQYGTQYGVKVKVAVQTDGKGDRIRSVEIVNSDYTEATDGAYWNNGGREKWDAGIDALVASYRGKYVGEVLLVNVPQDEDGIPLDTSSGGLSADSGFIISGATAGSSRLLLAVQNALVNAAESMGYKYYDGEYKHENAYASGSYYGIKVRVAVKGGTVKAVGILPSDYTEATESWSGKAGWDKNVQGLLNSYIGKSVSKITAVEVSCSSSGEPLSTEKGGLPADSGYVLAGATVGSGRLLLAVQNALSKIEQ